MPIHTELLFVFHRNPLESRRQLEVTFIEIPGFSWATWQIVNYNKSERKLLYWFASGEQLVTRIQRSWAWISLISIQNRLCSPGCSTECFMSLLTILPLPPCCMYLLCIIGSGVTQPWATVPPCGWQILIWRCCLVGNSSAGGATRVQWEKQRLPI